MLHLLPDALPDPLLEFRHVVLAHQETRDLLEPLPGLFGLEQLLPFLDPQRQVGADEVGQAVGVGRAAQRRHHFRRQPLRKAHVVFELAQGHPHQRLVFLVRLPVRDKPTHDRLDVGVLRGKLTYLAPAHALDHHLDRAVGHAKGLKDVRRNPHAVQVVLARLLDRGIALRAQEQRPLRGEALFYCGKGSRPPHDQRHHHPRENDDILEGQQR
jgi:hypothetical protein